MNHMTQQNRFTNLGGSTNENVSTIHSYYFADAHLFNERMGTDLHS